jgi:hypothetical protein
VEDEVMSSAFSPPKSSRLNGSAKLSSIQKPGSMLIGNVVNQTANGSPEDNGKQSSPVEPTDAPEVYLLH